jgi:hypothetical protein
MPIDAAILVAAITGFFGALVVTGIGVRFTRNHRALLCGGVVSGAALGAFMYVAWGWVTHGFVWAQISIPLLAALVLLLVMTAQNWFVFYEDRRDVVQSSRPALVMLAAAVAAMLARRVAGDHSFYLLLIWASAASLAILLCVDPVQRSIERTRSVLVGVLVGLGKILIPLTGVVVFLRRIESSPPERMDVGDEPGTFGRNWFLIDLVGLFWDLGQLALLILINGARIPPRPAALDPFEILGEMPRLKRNSVVMIFVLAIHVLCGVVIAKA